MVEAYREEELLVLPHDGKAASLARGLAAWLAASVSATVEHIGSTAVPGMPGKNGINLLVVAPEPHAVVAKLEELGLAPHPAKTLEEPWPLRVASKDGYPVHVQVVEEGTPAHYGPLFMREYLIAFPEAAAAYAELKRSLIESGADAHAYGKGKQPFIRDIIAKRPAGWTKPGDPLI